MKRFKKIMLWLIALNILARGYWMLLDFDPSRELAIIKIEGDGRWWGMDKDGLYAWQDGVKRRCCAAIPK